MISDMSRFTVRSASRCMVAYVVSTRAITIIVVVMLMVSVMVTIVVAVKVTITLKV